jgi:cell division protein FtsB
MKRLKNIGFIFFLLFFFSLLTKSFFEYEKNVSFYESYKKDYEREKKANTQLKTEVLKKNDPNEIEKTIRNKLNLLKEGEIAVIIPSPTPAPSTPSITPPPPYKQWLALFFKN